MYFKMSSTWEDSIIIKLQKWSGKLWIGFVWLRIGTSERGNKPSGSIKDGKFLD
jgi:hypothetical protein